MESLIVIDDSKIRSAAFSQIEKVVRRVDWLEDQLINFCAEQGKYDTWVEQTFRIPKLELQKLSADLEKLEAMHDWAHVVSHGESLSFADAFSVVWHEEKRYQQALPAEREAILLKRRERDVSVNRDGQASEPGGNESEPAATFSQESIALIAAQSDEALSRKLWQPAFAYNTLLTIYRDSHEAEKWPLFLRVWNLVPASIHPEITEVFNDVTGEGLEELVFKLRAYVEKIPTKLSRVETEAQAQSALVARRLLYHRLARLVHPDLHAAESGNAWRFRFWHLAQEAYRSDDRDELEILFAFAKLRSGNSDSLTFSEIKKCKHRVNVDLKRLQKKTKHLKNFSAWGFSSLKDLSVLRKKVEVELGQDRQMLLRKIAERKEQQAMLLEMAGTS